MIVSYTFRTIVTMFRVHLQTGSSLLGNPTSNTPEAVSEPSQGLYVADGVGDPGTGVGEWASRSGSGLVIILG